jgi:uncharacterized protein YyaL (SSP411 family)
MIGSNKIFSILLVAALTLTSFQPKPGDENLSAAKSTLRQIFRLYDAGHDNLLNEYYPVKPGNKVSYLAGNDTVTGTRVAYLWPTSGVLSGVIALMETAGDKQYLKILEKKVIPGLDNYFDSQRNPPCYQSYLTITGKSDRYYDDNIWLALDFCKLYELTGNTAYLEKAVTLWQFIISGWDENLGGGIYWCEQKKQSKNTCSNAPASVLALKLFEATRDSSYFNKGLLIYNWTKTNLQDPADFLYFDNKNLTGRVDKKKYTYNTGQMLQAAALLYNLTGSKEYLEEAQHIALSAIDYFTEDFLTPEGKKIRLFKNTGNWFNAVLLRGYAELYRIDGNDKYLNIFNDNLDHLLNHISDKNGLFSKDWKGAKEDQYKWLLDQAAIVEMCATLSE